jgi:hypothetical protein
VTDQEAMLTLAEPEPDYHDDPEGWQDWHDRKLLALAHARRVRRLLDPCPWPR